MRKTLSGLALGRRSVHGADLGARTAFDTGVGIDEVLAVLLGDNLDRALVHAIAAAYAFVSDDVGHFNFLLDGGHKLGHLAPLGDSRI